MLTPAAVPLSARGRLDSEGRSGLHEWSRLATLTPTAAALTIEAGRGGNRTSTGIAVAGLLPKAPISAPREAAGRRVDCRASMEEVLGLAGERARGGRAVG
jgi:hypothetical protein